MLAGIAKIELSGHLHLYYQCKKNDYTKLSTVDERRQKGFKRKFQHVWLEDHSLAFEETTGIWWLLYFENEGLFCLLCRKHNVDNPSNKSKIFNAAPSVRFRKEAIIEHSKGRQIKVLFKQKWHKGCLCSTGRKKKESLSRMRFCTMHLLHSIGLLKKVSPTRNSSHC